MLYILFFIQIRVSRRLPNGGRKPLFVELEAQLYDWISLRNQKGLRVKDKFIVAKMKNIKDECLAGTTDKNLRDKLNDFKASHSWLQRFKDRYDLVSRRETSCRTLPKDYQNIATKFLAETQTLILDKKITRNRIYNFDQVPRYIELNTGSTITKKGTKNVTLKKANTSHKKFTFTPMISASGEFTSLHLLFSNLKNKPKVNEKCQVNVNKSGMWNMETLNTFFDKTKIQSPFREACLIILDSYGSHLKYLQENEELFNKKNIYFAVIPPSLTGLLQPLDVAINRSFQQYFNDLYTEYLENALESLDDRTKAGNVKPPSYYTLSNWCLEWSKSMSKEQVFFFFLF